MIKVDNMVHVFTVDVRMIGKGHAFPCGVPQCGMTFGLNKTLELFKELRKHFIEPALLLNVNNIILSTRLFIF